jgi:RNA chaperone Hfq
VPRRARLRLGRPAARSPGADSNDAPAEPAERQPPDAASNHGRRSAVKPRAQEGALTAWRNAGSPLRIYVLSGAALVGRVIGWDSHTVSIQSGSGALELIYKKAILSIVPIRGSHSLSDRTARRATQR